MYLRDRFAWTVVPCISGIDLLGQLCHVSQGQICLDSCALYLRDVFAWAVVPY